MQRIQIQHSDRASREIRDVATRLFDTYMVSSALEEVCIYIYMYTYIYVRSEMWLKGCSIRTWYPVPWRRVYIYVHIYIFIYVFISFYMCIAIFVYMYM
jgi:hypothetical protein